MAGLDPVIQGQQILSDQLYGLTLVLIQLIAKLFTGLEKRHEFFFHRHRSARPRIAARPCRTMLDGKRTKPAQLNAIPAHKRIHDLVKYHVHDALDVAMIQMRIGRRDLLDKF